MRETSVAVLASLWVVEERLNVLWQRSAGQVCTDLRGSLYFSLSMFKDHLKKKKRKEGNDQRASATHPSLLFLLQSEKQTRATFFCWCYVRSFRFFLFILLLLLVLHLLVAGTRNEFKGQIPAAAAAATAEEKSRARNEQKLGRRLSNIDLIANLNRRQEFSLFIYFIFLPFLSPFFVDKK